MKFGTRVRLKPSNDRGEFELDRARSENNIAENSFALGHETHNSVNNQYIFFQKPIVLPFIQKNLDETIKEMVTLQGLVEKILKRFVHAFYILLC